jgi:hypothetical protein
MVGAHRPTISSPTIEPLLRWSRNASGHIPRTDTAHSATARAFFRGRMIEHSHDRRSEAALSRTGALSEPAAPQRKGVSPKMECAIRSARQWQLDRQLSSIAPN